MTAFFKNSPPADKQQAAHTLELLSVLEDTAAPAGQGWHVLGDDLAFPLAVLRRSALMHNLQWMQAYADRRGVLLAPHGKTTMSPQLFRMQLDAGAWGITFGTVYQWRVGVACGVRRSIIANQVVGAAELSALQHTLRQDPGLQVWFLVDSLAQLQCIEDWFAAQPLSDSPIRPFDVLLEIGIPGKRTGCRSLEDAMQLAKALHASPCVRLCGLECYEGNAANGDSAHDIAAVTELVRRVLEVARGCEALELFDDEAGVMLSAGGSAVFDLVMPLLRHQGLGRPVRGVLRSGCYVTHDHGNYRHYLKGVEHREGWTSSLRPALEVWALVQSVPEPGLALLGCGKRDISYDLDLPLPQRIARRGARSMQALEDVPPDWKITALNDQHAYLRFDPAGPVPAVGDRVVLGISHPCTTFDKWRWMPLMEDDGRVTGAITTRF